MGLYNEFGESMKKIHKLEEEQNVKILEFFSASEQASIGSQLSYKLALSFKTEVTNG